MKNGKIRIVVGWILLLLQVVSWFGLSSANMKLWNDADDTFQYIPSSSSNLNFAEWCFAFEIGNEKFTSSFTNMFTNEDEYISLTSNEYASIYIRESLGARDENYNFSLFLFDFNLLIGYMFYGILGLLLLVFGYKAKNVEIASRLDDIENDKSKKSKIICIILLSLAVILKILNFEISLTAISLIFLLIFFIAYIGKKKSILLSSAIILFAIDSIWYFFTTINNWFSMDTDSLNFWTFPALIFAVLSLATGICYFICGIKLYLGKEKFSIRKPIVIGMIFTTLEALIWPVILSITYDSLFLRWIDVSALIFITVIAIYVIKIPCQIEFGELEHENIEMSDSKEQVESQEYTEQNNHESEEFYQIEKSLDKKETIEDNENLSSKQPCSQELLFCRKCGTQLLNDSVFCNKCGSKVEHL